MAEEDIATFDEHTKLDEDDAPEVDAGGTTLSQADQTQLVDRMVVVEQLVRQAINAEHKFSQEIKDSPNASFEVQFRRYTFPTTGDPIMICQEKHIRRRVLITCYGATATTGVFIGRHRGITAAGLDTVKVAASVAGTAREVYTKRALWAVQDQVGTDLVIDVQEEYID